MKKQIRIYIYIIGLILIDQLSKVWALSALRGTEGIAVIPNVFELSYLENRGAAFWNPSGSSDFLCIDHSSCRSDLNMDLSENTTDEEIYTTSYQLCIDHGRSVWKSDRQSIQGICG